MTTTECRTGRTRYRTQGAAFAALERITNRPIDPSNPFDFHRPEAVRSCPKCRGFHLTSKTGKRWAKGKRARDLRVGSYRRKG